MIPYNELHPGAVDALRRYLIHEVRKARSERSALEQRWMFFQRQYKMLPEKAKKVFPFLGASNLEIGIIATDVDIVYSRIMGQLFGGGMGLWTTHSYRPELQDVAKSLRELLRWAEEHELNAYEAVADWVLEICKLGTGVLKERYHREEREVYEFRETPQGVHQAERIVWMKNHPQLHHVSILDFLVPTNTGTDLQAAPWCAERIYLTWAQLVTRVQQGIYMNPALQGTGLSGELTLQPIRQWWARGKQSQYMQYRQELNYLQPGEGDLFEIYEIWTQFDIKNTGRGRSLVCALHLDSESYLRLDWNPFLNQEYPYDVARYMRQEGQFYGIGIAEMASQTQIEVTTQHNQRIDNATIQNMSLFGAKANGSIKKNEPLWPGRILHMAEKDDFWRIEMGTKMDSTIQNEQMTLNHNQRRTGVSDFVSGNVDPSIGYAAATTNVMQQREGAKRFDQTFREIRRSLSGAGMRILELYQQYDQQGKQFVVLGEKDGENVTKVLQFPTDLMRFSFAVDVASSDTSMSRDVEIRINTLLYQMLTDNTQRNMQILMMAFNPQMPPPLQAMLLQSVEASGIMLRRIFEAHGIQDINQIVPLMSELLNGGQSAPAQPDPYAAAIGGGNGMGSGLALPPGLPYGATGPVGAAGPGVQPTPFGVRAA